MEWIAYTSDSSGRAEIYVRPFPNVDDGRWQISSAGGTRALWSRDGRELFYLAPGARLMAVGVETEPTFAPGSAELLFDGYYMGSPGRPFDISPDGERFLMIQENANGTSTELTLVVNWHEELIRRVPTAD